MLYTDFIEKLIGLQDLEVKKLNMTIIIYKFIAEDKKTAID